MKRILIGMLAVMMAMPVFAEDTPAVGDKTTTSQPYVKTQVDLKQGLIPAAGTNSALGDTVVTYTSNGEGEIGERGIYTGGTYDASTDADKLITASALNTAFTTLPTKDTTTLECANPGTCTLWTIVDQTAYGDTITLPEGYTRLAYIESTGTQYIKLAAFPTASSIDITADLLHTDGTNEQIFLAPSSNEQYLYTVSSGWRVWKSGGGATSLGTLDDRHTFVMKVTSLGIEYYVDGVKNTQASNIFTSNVFSGRVLNIGARTTASGGGDYFWKGKIYSFKATCDGVSCMRLVPAKYGTTVGMYDIVNNRFYQNQGSGNFVAGPEMN